MGSSEGNPLAALLVKGLPKPKSKDDTDGERLEALMEEYQGAKDNKGKARALRAFVRLASRYEKGD